MAHPASELRVFVVKAQKLTREAFLPFGDVISVDGLDTLPIDLYSGTIDLYRPGYFESDQPVEFLLARSRFRPFELRYLERHLQITQTFIPLAGHPFMVAVARPEAEESDGLPKPDEIHAFVVPGDSAVNLKRGTWHEPPFPLVDGALTLITSHQALTRGLGSDLDRKGEIGKLDVDKRNVAGRIATSIRIELP